MLLKAVCQGTTEQMVGESAVLNYIQTSRIKLSYAAFSMVLLEWYCLPIGSV